MSLISTDKFISEGNVRIDKVQKSNENYKALKNNIKAIGIQTPITYRKNDKGDFVVINGHQRLQIAKDLKLTEIPAYLSNGEVDDLTKQLSTNMFTVPMSHLDASFAIDQMVEKGIVTTKKALKAKFGKSSEWVDVALAFCNIHPLIREYFKENTVSDEAKESLMEISKSTVTQQEIEIGKLIGNDEIRLSSKFIAEFTDFIEDYGYYESDSMADFLDDLAKNLETDENKWEFICKVIGKETFREYETSHDVTHEYQNTLFQEYADTQWCQENSFLAEVFLAETPIGHFILEKDLPYVEERAYNGLRFDFNTTVATLKKNLKAETGVGLKNISIDGWSGNVFNPYLSYTILEESQEPESYEDEHGEEDTYDADTDKSTDKDPHWLKYNKFNKVAAPVIEIYLLDHIDTSIKNTDKVNITFEWIMNTLDIMTDFSIGWNEEDKHPLQQWFEEKESLSNDDIIQKMANHWFIKHYASADFRQLDVLLKTQGLKSCKEILKDTYDSEKEEMGILDGMVFRKAYLSVLSKAELVELEGSQDAKTMTKSNLVQLIANKEQDELPFFDLVCTNLGSGTNDLGGYLK